MTELENPLLSESTSHWERLIESVDPASLLLVIDRRMTPALKQVVTAEDILQESLLHAWRDRKKFAWQGIKSFRAWLLTIAAREDSVREFLAQAEALEETDRMLLIQCGLEDETCAQAATKLGLSEEAAIKRWQRLKAKLRELPWSREILGLEPGTAERGKGEGPSG